MRNDPRRGHDGRRPCAPVAAFALAIAAPSFAFAEVQTVGDFQVELVIPDGQGGWDPITQEDLAEIFNVASCTCVTSPQFGIEMRMTTPPAADLGSEKIQLWSGSSCNTTDVAQQTANCESLIVGDAPTLNQLHDQETIVALDVRALMYPTTPSPCACAERDATTTIFLLVDRNSDRMFEVDLTLPTTFDIDTDPPPPVESLVAKGVEDGILLEWSLPDPSDDIDAYQVLCRSAVDGQPLLRERNFEPEYEVPSAICGVDRPPDTCAMPTVDAGVPPMIDAGPIDAAPPVDAGAIADASAIADAGPTIDAALPVPGWQDLAAEFLCSGRIAPESVEFRLDLEGVDLDVAEEVEVVLVVIDDHRNATVMASVRGLPEPVVDFWETYEDAMGDAKGGHCFIATAAYGDYDDPSVRVLRDFRDGTLARTESGRRFIREYYRASPPLAAWLRRQPGGAAAARAMLAPVVIVAGLWEHGLPRLPAALGVLALLVGFAQLASTWRARRRVAVAAAGAAAVLIVALGVASAQGIPVDEDEPWLDDEMRAAAPPNWAFEIKFGPYYPGIDDEPGLAYPPYQTMFGDESSLLSQIELDRFFLHPKGQLGIGATIGYLQNTALSFRQAADGTPILEDPRSEDETSFHLIPTSLSAIYRFTMIADETVVPLVPYAKVGLSYYFWWITKGDGDTSNTDMKGVASGGTLGWQATIGITFRLDMLDPAASQDMLNEFNVDHVGLFFEGTYADVSGLGMDDKLYVGDVFWSAGLNFEF